MSSIRDIALAKAIGSSGPSVTVEPLSVTENATYNAGSGKAYNPVTVNVPTGGVNVPAKDVNFYDYDGTIVAAYTAAEFASLDALPPNPDHTSDDLTAQGWNWSLADAKSYVASYGGLEVGQMYVTTDGKTHIHVHLEQGRTSPILGCCPDGTVDVDWGDGTSHDTLTGTSVDVTKWTDTHNYAAPGDYVIKLAVSEGGSMGFYGTTTDNQYCGLLRYSSSGDSRNNPYRDAIKCLFVGTGVTSIASNAFYFCSNLKNITIPNGVTSIDSKAFLGCFVLDGITIPSNVTSIGANAFERCFKLSFASIPNGVTSIGSSVFVSCYALSNISIPNGVTNIGDTSFGYNYYLHSLRVPNGVTSIGRMLATACYLLSSVTIPDSVTSIGDYAFNNCWGLLEIHFKPTTPPTLGGSSAFWNLPADCKIYVPTGHLADYTSAQYYPSSSTYTYVEE